MFRTISQFVPDFRASMVVFLVALPLGLGISLASGFPPVAGMISGIIGGVIVGLLSGSPLQVSGAAAGLTIVVLNGLNQLGFERLAWGVAIAGFLQVIGGMIGIGRWFRAISPTVLQALLSGIGLLIVFSQIYMLFDQKAPGGGLSNLLGLPSVFGQLGASATQQAVIVGALSLAFCVGAPWLPQKIRMIIPGPLLAIIAASAVCALAGFSIQMVTIPRDIWSQINWLSLSDWPLALSADVLIFALQLALIASAESLLCASAVDQLHSGPRTLFNRELLAQGVGNLLCGLVSCLPMTGVIVRSSANVQAGAQSRVSTVLHGLWMAISILMFPQVLELIPLAALAGLLVYTGCKLVNVGYVIKVCRTKPAEAFIFLSSLAVIVSYDLLLGVLVGCLLSVGKLLWALTHLEVKVERPEDGTAVQITMHGAATFLRLPQLAETLESLPPGERVAICNRQLHVVDRAITDLVQNWKSRYEKQGGAVLMPDWPKLSRVD